jgi:hypothetical protein
MSKADMVNHLQAELLDLLDSPGDGHPERAAEINEQLKGLGEDMGEFWKTRRADRDRLAEEVEAIRDASGDTAAEFSPAAQRVAKLDAHLPGKAAKHG